jgi:hypothetical protein
MDFGGGVEIYPSKTAVEMLGIELLGYGGQGLEMGGLTTRTELWCGSSE